jgi:hypothetical protein
MKLIDLGMIDQFQQGTETCRNSCEIHLFLGAVDFESQSSSTIDGNLDSASAEIGNFGNLCIRYSMGTHLPNDFIPSSTSSGFWGLGQTDSELCTVSSLCEIPLIIFPWSNKLLTTELPTLAPDVLLGVIGCLSDVPRAEWTFCFDQRQNLLVGSVWLAPRW